MADKEPENGELSQLISDWFMTVDTNKRDMTVNEIAARLSQSHLKLINLIEALGAYLVSEDREQRKGAISLLSNVLLRVKDNLFSVKEVTHLCEFYCSRINDHHSILSEVLPGLSALSTFEHLSDGNACSMARAIFQHIQTQSLVQLDRKIVLQIIFNLLQRKMPAMKSIDQDFVFGYIQIVDGEKDPRNLLMVFKTVPIIVENFDIKMFAEDLFEVTACYFPIDFHPPPGDKFCVKKIDLELGLRTCMSASPLFAEFAMPLILEKLTSDVDDSKLAALETLSAAAETFRSEGLAEFANSLWSALSREVLMEAKAEIEKAALDALCSMVRALDEGKRLRNDNELEEFCKLVVKDCARHLAEPDMKLMLSAGKLLTAVCVGSECGAKLVYGQTVPVLMKEFNKSSIVSSRCSVLDVMIGYIEAGIRFASLEGTHPLSEFVDDLCAIFLSLNHHAAATIRCRSLRGSCALLPYSHNHHSHIIEGALSLAITDSNVDVRKEADSVLNLVSHQHTQLFIAHSLPRLLQLIRESNDSPAAGGTCPNPEKHENENQFTSVMRTVVTICTNQLNVAELVIPVVVNRVKEQLAVSNESECGIRSNTEHYMKVLVSALLEIIEKSQSNIDLIKFAFREITKSLVSVCIDTLGYSIVESVMKHIYRIVIVSMSKLDEELTLPYSEEMVALFLSHISSDTDGNLLFSPHQTRLLYLLCGIISSMPQNVHIPQLTRLLENLELLALSAENEFVRTISCKFYAQIVNKMPLSPEMDQFLEVITSRLKSNLSDHRNLILWIWMAKALVCRGHRMYKIYLDQIIERLNTDEGELSSTAFRIILSPDEDVMNEWTHSNIRLMFKQRLFSESLPRLVDGFKAAEKSKKAHYLTSLSHLLTHVPKQVVVEKLPALLPLFIQSLESPSASLWMSTMDTIATLLPESKEILTPYADSLIDQFLKLSKFESDMNVRINALRCLSVCTQLPGYVLLPHRKNVLTQLRVAVDDRKRLVRKQAVRARCDWSLIGSATE